MIPHHGTIASSVLVATLLQQWSNGSHNRLVWKRAKPTGATQLFDAGVPQRIIQERTGHKSVLSLHTYEWISNHQNQAVSNILTSSTSGSFQEEVATVKAASIKIDTGDLDAAFAKDLALFDLIPMDFLQ